MLTRDNIEKFFGTWTDLLTPFVQSQAFDSILAELKQQKSAGRVVVPDSALTFRIFKEMPIEKVRIIIIGQDPYPAAEYANGIAFSIPKETGAKAPASLQAIVNKIEDEMHNGIDFDKSVFDVSLQHWLDQGIMLINTALTVASTPQQKEDGTTVEVMTPGSHQALWKPFIDYFLTSFNEISKDKIYIALGVHAQEAVKSINVFKNYVFAAEHPSFAAKEKRKWENHDFFTKVNACIRHNQFGDPIKW